MSKKTKASTEINWLKKDHHSLYLLKNLNKKGWNCKWKKKKKKKKNPTQSNMVFW